MGQIYKQLSVQERCEIARLRAAGQSLRQIATTLDRQTSTLSRELKRNTGAKGYDVLIAQNRAWARKWRGCKLLRQPALQSYVLERLAMGWSPQQVAGRLTQDQASMRISYESIYRFIYAQIARTQNYKWRLYLPHGKAKRGVRSHKKRSSVLSIKNRVPVHQRPLEALNRSVPGHWEADTMLFSTYGQAMLVVHERSSRFTCLVRTASKAADGIATQLQNIFKAVPAHLRRSLTFDNGTEFARHYRLNKNPGMPTFFCDPHKPWQKGGVENANARLRRFLPRKTDLNALSEQDILTYAAMYNNTPRKCLGYKTPAEIFFNLLKPLHFKCESTFPLSRE